MKCIRRLHEWSGQADAEKCCNGWIRVFDMEPGQAVLPETPRRVWEKCSPHTETVHSDGRAVCMRCGMILKCPHINVTADSPTSPVTCDTCMHRWDTLADWAAHVEEASGRKLVPLVTEFGKPKNDDVVEISPPISFDEVLHGREESVSGKQMFEETKLQPTWPRDRTAAEQLDGVRNGILKAIADIRARYGRDALVWYDKDGTQYGSLDRVDMEAGHHPPVRWGGTRP